MSAGSTELYCRKMHLFWLLIDLNSGSLNLRQWFQNVPKMVVIVHIQHLSLNNGFEGFLRKTFGCCPKEIVVIAFQKLKQEWDNWTLFASIFIWLLLLFVKCDAECVYFRFRARFKVCEKYITLGFLDITQSHKWITFSLKEKAP